MKLYESPSPNARRVQIFMAEKGVDIPREAVDIRAGENLGDEYKAKNPAGRVPVLELDDGSFLSESVAICRYLEGQHPSPNLFGETPLEMAVIEMWNRRAELNYFLEVAGAFRNISGFFKDRETCVPEWGELCAERAIGNLAFFDRQLSQSEYLAGDRFSVADITFGAAVDFTGMVSKMTKKEFPIPGNVKRWHDNITQRASWAAT